MVYTDIAKSASIQIINTFAGTNFLPGLSSKFGKCHQINIEYIVPYRWDHRPTWVAVVYWYTIDPYYKVAREGNCNNNNVAEPNCTSFMYRNVMFYSYYRHIDTSLSLCSYNEAPVNIPEPIRNRNDGGNNALNCLDPNLFWCVMAC